MTVMHLRSIERIEVSPEKAEQRAQGRLIMPHMEKTIQREALIVTGTDRQSKKLYSFPEYKYQL